MNPGSTACPICARDSDSAVSSDLYRCRWCGLIFNANSISLSYDRDYFISEYRNQYGRTYIDDFENIYRLSALRLDKIFAIAGKKRGLKSALDIGSAAGFFLKAAKDMGVKKLKGIEISDYASEYCREYFGIDAVNSSFEDSVLNEKFDIITSWFFIEHLSDPLSAMKKIYSMLNAGGVFALAIPSCFGPMFLFDRDEWVRTHPKDHRIDLSPGSAKKILKEIGYKKVKVVRCGYHPERVLSRENILYRPFEFIYRLYTSVSAFSDTIEIYAVK